MSVFLWPPVVLADSTASSFGTFFVDNNGFSAGNVIYNASDGVYYGCSGDFFAGQNALKSHASIFPNNANMVGSGLATTGNEGGTLTSTDGVVLTGDWENQGEDFQHDYNPDFTGGTYVWGTVLRQSSTTGGFLGIVGGRYANTATIGLGTARGAYKGSASTYFCFWWNGTNTRYQKFDTGTNTFGSSTVLFSNNEQLYQMFDAGEGYYYACLSSSGGFAIRGVDFSSGTPVVTGNLGGSGAAGWFDSAVLQSGCRRYFTLNGNRVIAIVTNSHIITITFTSGTKGTPTITHTVLNANSVPMFHDPKGYTVEADPGDTTKAYVVLYLRNQAGTPGGTLWPSIAATLDNESVTTSAAGNDTGGSGGSGGGGWRGGAGNTVGFDRGQGGTSMAHSTQTSAVTHTPGYQLGAGYVNLSYSGGPTNFSYTGSEVTFVVPGGVTSIAVDMAGGQGATNTFSGGYGARLQATLTVTPGETLRIGVGGAGTNQASAAGGVFAGGGGCSFSSALGGGSSYIKRGGTGDADRVLVAGGGGGGGQQYNPDGVMDILATYIDLANIAGGWSPISCLTTIVHPTATPSNFRSSSYGSAMLGETVKSVCLFGVSQSFGSAYTYSAALQYWHTPVLFEPSLNITSTYTSVDLVTTATKPRGVEINSGYISVIAGVAQAGEHSDTFRWKLEISTEVTSGVDINAAGYASVSLDSAIITLIEAETLTLNWTNTGYTFMDDFMVYLNADRAASGRPPLKTYGLDGLFLNKIDVATYHATQMVQLFIYEHDDGGYWPGWETTALRRDRMPATSMSENLQSVSRFHLPTNTDFGYPTAYDLWLNWHNSPGHYANMVFNWGAQHDKVYSVLGIAEGYRPLADSPAFDPYTFTYACNNFVVLETLMFETQLDQYWDNAGALIATLDQVWSNDAYVHLSVRHEAPFSIRVAAQHQADWGARTAAQHTAPWGFGVLVQMIHPYEPTTAGIVAQNEAPYSIRDTVSVVQQNEINFSLNVSAWHEAPYVGNVTVQAQHEAEFRIFDTQPVSLWHEASYGVSVAGQAEHPYVGTEALKASHEAGWAIKDTITVQQQSEAPYGLSVGMWSEAPYTGTVVVRQQHEAGYRIFNTTLLQTQHESVYGVSVARGHEAPYVGTVTVHQQHEAEWLISSTTPVRQQHEAPYTAGIVKQHELRWAISTSIQKQHEASYGDLVDVKAQHELPYSLLTSNAVRVGMTHYWNLQDYVASLVNNNAVTLTLPDGRKVVVDDGVIESNESDVGYTFECSIADLDVFKAIHEDDEITVDFCGEIYNFIVNTKSMTRDGPTGISFRMSATNAVVRTGPPYAQATTYVQDGNADASVLVDALVEIDFTYEIVDWPILSGRLQVAGATSLEAITQIAEAAGGVVDGDIDGSMRIRYPYPVPMNALDTVPADQVYSDDYDNLSVTVQTQYRDGANRFRIREGDVSYSDSLEWVPDEKQTTSGLQTGLLKAYLSPYRTGAQIVHLGNAQVFTLGDEATEELEELVEFNEGAGNTQRPIHQLISFTWYTADMGVPSFTPFSTIFNVGTSVNNGYGIAKVVYNTKYLTARVSGVPANVESGKVGPASSYGYFILEDSNA